MKTIIRLTLYSSVASIVLILIYKFALTENFGAIWLVAISVLGSLACFAVWSLRSVETEKRDTITNAWTVLVSVATAYVLLDLASGYFLIRPLSPALVPDRIVHHRMMPNSRSVIETPDYRTVITTNQFGLRGRELPLKKDPGTYRILMLGDSFTLGKGVENGETFSALLERRLGTNDRPVEVLNGGVDSYSPVLSYLALRERFAELDPDLVVLNLDMSDLVQEEVYRRHAVYDDRRNILGVPNPNPADEGVGGTAKRFWLGGTIKRWIEDHLYVGRMALHYVDRLTRDLADRSVRNVVELAHPALLAHTLASNNGRHDEVLWENIFDSIMHTKRFCDQRGVRFFMTTYPWGHQINDREWTPGRSAFLPDGAVTTDRSLQIIGDWSNENGIALLNLFPAFRARQAEGPLYYDLDMHWRPKGHEIMAEELENYIRKALFQAR